MTRYEIVTAAGVAYNIPAASMEEAENRAARLNRCGVPMTVRLAAAQGVPQ